jgi:purine-binding chemotaxis protein CheW
MPLIADGAGPKRWLLCRAGARLCALPIETIVETMRRLPIEPLARAQPFVLGMSVVRGAPVPVVDVAALLGEPAVNPERLVTLRVGERVVALALNEVLGLREISGAAVPPLLKDAAGEVVAAIGALDAELLLVLNAARAIPQDVLTALAAEGAS